MLLQQKLWIYYSCVFSLVTYCITKISSITTVTILINVCLKKIFKLKDIQTYYAAIHIYILCIYIHTWYINIYYQWVKSVVEFFYTNDNIYETTSDEVIRFLSIIINIYVLQPSFQLHQYFTYSAIIYIIISLFITLIIDIKTIDGSRGVGE